MEAAEPGQRLQREWRAIGLIALAAFTVAVASVAYLNPDLTSHRSLAAKPISISPGKSSPLVLEQSTNVAYDFVSPSVGWALEVPQVAVPGLSHKFLVFQTVDGARHWHKQLTGESPSVQFGAISVRFFDKTHGFFAIGNPSELYRTADGGAHWDAIGLPNYESSMFTFSDPRHGWFIGGFGPGKGATTVTNLYSTTDGGTSWLALPNPPPDLGLLAFRRPSEGWAAGSGRSQPKVYSTIDAGMTWQPHLLPADPTPKSGNGSLFPIGKGTPQYPDSFYAYVDLLPGNGVVAFTSAGAGFTSFDGGLTWRRIAPPPGELGYVDFHYQDASHWWGMRSGTLYKSSDAGQSWAHIAQQLDDWEYLPNVIDSKHAWAELIPAVQSPTAPHGTGLALTSDGGLHWTQVVVPQSG